MGNEEIKYISLSEAAEMTDYSQEYISLLCRTKRMKGTKLGRNWVTTSEWVREYIDKTKGYGEFIIPVRVEKKKIILGAINNNHENEKEAGVEKELSNIKPINSRLQFLTFNEVALFTFFFGIIIAAFAYFQQMLIMSFLK